MNELLIDLDPSAGHALYEQIYESIRRDMIDGRFSHGERLPSSRQLAASLQVSRSTVDAAYAQLVSEGYLKAKRGSGYYACDISGLYHLARAGQADREERGIKARAGKVDQEESRAVWQAGYEESRAVWQAGQEKSSAKGQAGQADCGESSAKEQAGHGESSITGWAGYPSVRTREIADRASGSVSGRTSGKKQEVKYKYNFLPGRIDSSGFAYNAWRKASKEALLELETKGSLLSAGHPQGEYRLRSAIASYLYRARGVRCEPGQIIAGAGNEYLLQLLGQILGGPRLVAMESPTYLQAYHTFCNIGCQVAAVPMDLSGMRVEEIPENGVSLAYVMPSHQFPLGCVMPLERRMQLLSWAEGGKERYIIEDDHDSEFRYKGRPIPSLQGMARLDQVIYLGTFTNSIMPSIRMSYMVLPPQLVPEYERKCGFYASTVSRIQQMSVCQFMEAGAFERHLNKMRGIYKTKHDLLLSSLKGRPWVHRIYGSYAGLHIAVELNCDLTERELIGRAAAQGICIQGMSGCYIEGSKKPDKNPVLLLGFGDLLPHKIKEGVDVLEGCLETGRLPVEKIF